MAKGEDLITFEQALENKKSEFHSHFKDHVNPGEASIFKLANVDKRYVRAEGVSLWDAEGREYLDFTAGFGSLNLGHNPAEVINAVHQARRLPAVILMGYNPLMGAVGENLSRLLPGDLSVSSFGSGGAEAVELALKIARGSTRRKKFVSCENAYHGLSLGALSVCACEKHHSTVGPLLDNCVRIPFGDLQALEKSLSGNDVAGFIVEPIQGEGGAVVPPEGYLKSAEELCRKHGTLLILDEIQTGFGRTGKMFALDHEKVEPDVVTLSKSLASGVVPMSVAVTSPDHWKKAFGGKDNYDMVISTFGGHSAACAAALKTMELMVRDKIAERTSELGDYAKASLVELAKKHDSILEVRGKGLFLGLKLKGSGFGAKLIENNFSGLIINRLLNEHGIMTVYYDLDPSVLRFEPPLIVTREQIDVAVAAIDAVLSKSNIGLTMSFGASAVGRMVRG